MKSPLKTKNWLLAQSRAWHKWGGLTAGLFVALAAGSGIVLNYKQPVFSFLGIEKAALPPEKSFVDGSGPKLEFSTGRGVAGLPIGLEHAMEVARTEWGDVPLERVELKLDRAGAFYKIKQKTGQELWVNAATGTHFLKGQYERIGKPGPDGSAKRSIDWGKILIDLHTGKIGGEAGRAVMSVAAVLLLMLTLSGVYLWLKPLLIRRHNARAVLAPSRMP